MAPESSENFTANVRQQTAGRVLDAQLAQSVAAIVERHHALQARADIFHPGDLREKRGELPNALFERMYARQRFGLLVEQLREVVDDHSGAGTRRHHHRLARFESIQEVARHGPRLVAISAVECRLPAAGLVFRKIHLASGAFQDVGHRHAHLWEELVHHAGHEQRHPSTHAVNDCIRWDMLQLVRRAKLALLQMLELLRGQAEACPTSSYFAARMA
jgi:hypothetical protein